MILLECVPREIDTFVSEVTQALQDHTELTGINIPDVKRLAHRSYDMAEILLEKDIMTVPHIRTRDRSEDDSMRLISQLQEKGLKDLLLISGDPPSKKANVQQFDVTPVQLTKRLKKSYPDLNVYCGLDPYRHSFQEEFNYAKEKCDAGADGLFTQPFFDPRYVDIYCEQFAHTTLFIGCSPVTTPASVTYWQTVNKAFFPRGFDFSVEANSKVAKDILEVVKDHQQHLYLMPIRIDIKTYLEGIFS